MKISIIGTGYVGLVTGTCLAELGNDVILVDVIKEKVDKINSGESPIYERGLDDLLKKNLSEKRIKATLDLKSAVLNTDMCFICVGTPSKEDGSIDLKYIESAAGSIGDTLKERDSYFLVVVKSTVLPKTTEDVVIPILEKNSSKNSGYSFGVCMNPEFLREGVAVEDFMNPNRIVIGKFDKKSGDMLNELYKNFSCPVLRVNLRTAEMIKYASNAFLAARISLINEVGNICKKLGIDTYDVAKGIGLDNRIGPKFLRSGAGFGGSCFSKDISALIAKARQLNYEPKMIEEILNVDKRQKTRLVEQLEEKIGNLKDKKVAVLGLSFKPDSDDIREASAINIISALKQKGALVNVYDPKAMDNFKNIFPDVFYFENAQEALKDSDACLLVTEWDEFKNLKDEDFDLMKNKIIIEGRKILDKNNVKDFDGICW